MEFKLYDTDQIFTVKKPVQAVIEDVCMVMCQRKDITDVDRYHYADIAGFPLKEDKHGNKFIDFDLKYTKSTYPLAIAKVLFDQDVTDPNIDRAEVHRALGFFFNGFGEITHDVYNFWNALTLARSLPETQKKLKDLMAGVKDIEES